MKYIKPTVEDHNKALQMCYSGLLSDEELNIYNIIAGSWAGSMDVQEDHYNLFLDIETRYDILTGLQDEFPDMDIDVKFKDNL